MVTSSKSPLPRPQADHCERLRNSVFGAIYKGRGSQREGLSVPRGAVGTQQAEIEAAFKAYTKRNDISVIIINQTVPFCRPLSAWPTAAV